MSTNYHHPEEAYNINMNQISAIYINNIRVNGNEKGRTPNKLFT